MAKYSTRTFETLKDKIGADSAQPPRYVREPIKWQIGRHLYINGFGNASVADTKLYNFNLVYYLMMGDPDSGNERFRNREHLFEQAGRRNDHLERFSEADQIEILEDLKGKCFYGHKGQQYGNQVKKARSNFRIAHHCQQLFYQLKRLPTTRELVDAAECSTRKAMEYLRIQRERAAAWVDRTLSEEEISRLVFILRSVSDIGDSDHDLFNYFLDQIYKTGIDLSDGMPETVLNWLSLDASNTLETNIRLALLGRYFPPVAKREKVVGEIDGFDLSVLSEKFYASRMADVMGSQFYGYTDPEFKKFVARFPGHIIVTYAPKNPNKWEPYTREETLDSVIRSVARGDDPKEMIEETMLHYDYDVSHTYSPEFREALRKAHTLHKECVTEDTDEHSIAISTQLALAEMRTTQVEIPVCRCNYCSEEIQYVVTEDGLSKAIEPVFGLLQGTKYDEAVHTRHICIVGKEYENRKIASALAWGQEQSGATAEFLTSVLLRRVSGSDGGGSESDFGCKVFNGRIVEASVRGEVVFERPISELDRLLESRARSSYLSSPREFDDLHEENFFY